MVVAGSFVAFNGSSEGPASRPFVSLAVLEVTASLGHCPLLVSSTRSCLVTVLLAPRLGHARLALAASLVVVVRPCARSLS